MRHVLPLYVLVRDPDLQLPHVALPAPLRLRIFLGRVRNSVSGISGPSPSQSAASSGIRNRTLTPAISPESVREAAERIKPLAHRTPVMTSHSVDERAGTQVFFK